MPTTPWFEVVAIAGDTVRCEGLDRLCAGADVYVQTVIQKAIVESIPMPRFQDILDYHSTVEDAGATAAANGVGTLVLTHVVPAPAPGGEEALIEQVRAGGFAGPVVVADDLTEVEA